MEKRSKNIFVLIIFSLVIITFPFAVGAGLRFDSFGVMLIIFLINNVMVVIGFGIMITDLIMRNIFKIINDYKVIVERILFRRFLYWYTGIFFSIYSIILIAGNIDSINFVNSGGVVAGSLILISFNIAPVYLGDTYLMINFRIIARAKIERVDIVPNKKGIEYTNVFLKDGEVIKYYMDKDIAKSFIKEFSCQV